MKALILIMSILPSSALAHDSFLSRGGACAAYQAPDEAVAQAHGEADKRAQTICLPRGMKAFRVSEFRLVGPAGSCFTIEAQYVCH